MKGSGIPADSMVMAYSNSLEEGATTRASGKTTRRMVLGLCCSVMVVFMKDAGKMICNMVMELLKMTTRNMMVTGLMVNSMDTERSH